MAEKDRRYGNNHRNHLKVVPGSRDARPQSDLDGHVYPEVVGATRKVIALEESIKSASWNNPDDVKRLFSEAASCVGKLGGSLLALLNRTRLLDRISRHERKRRIAAGSVIKEITAQLNAAKKEILSLRHKVDKQAEEIRKKDEEIARLKEQRDELEKKENIDELTGNYNKKFFGHRLSQLHSGASAGRKNFAVLYIDLDGFKHVNETLGRDAADDILKNAAQKITSTVRASDTVCRLSGDEFAVLLENVSPKDVLNIVQKYLRLSSSGNESTVFSIGAFLCDLDAARELSPSEVLKFANIAEEGAKGRIAKVKNDFPLTWDSTLPVARPRAAPAGNCGYAAIALRDPADRSLFVTGIPDPNDPNAVPMSERLVAFANSVPARVSDQALVSKRQPTPPDCKK